MIIECKTISSWNSIQRNYKTESYTTEFDGRLLLEVNEEDVFNRPPECRPSELTFDSYFRIMNGFVVNILYNSNLLLVYLL